MRALVRACLVLLLLGAAAVAWAQDTTRATPGVSASAPAASKAGVSGSQKQVVEDDQVRIEETRTRGQLQRVTVRNKQTGTAYEIIVSPAGRDPSQARGASGQRAWSLFDF